jgi:hypothetical protein
LDFCRLKILLSLDAGGNDRIEELGIRLAHGREGVRDEAGFGETGNGVSFQKKDRPFFIDDKVTPRDAAAAEDLVGFDGTILDVFKHFLVELGEGDFVRDPSSLTCQVRLEGGFEGEIQIQSRGANPGFDPACRPEKSSRKESFFLARPEGYLTSSR